MKYNSRDITKNIEQDDSIVHPRFLQEKQEKIPAFEALLLFGLFLTHYVVLLMFFFSRDFIPRPLMN